MKKEMLWGGRVRDVTNALLQNDVVGYVSGAVGTYTNVQQFFSIVFSEGGHL